MTLASNTHRYCHVVCLTLSIFSLSRAKWSDFQPSVHMCCAFALQALPLASAEARQHTEFIVDPVNGPIRTVHAAAVRMRQLLAASANQDISVLLAPGVHHVRADPLILGTRDDGRGGGIVEWRSLDPRNPASIGRRTPQHFARRCPRASRWAPRYGTFGCGAAAPHAPSYTATDFSPATTARALALQAQV